MQARLELADFLHKNGQTTQAVAELLAALDPAAHNAVEKKQIGRSLLDYGSPRQAATVFKDVLRSDARDSEAYAGLGAADLADDDFGAARNDFRSALRWNPEDEMSQKQLDFCSRAEALDPDAGKLRSAERNRRSIEILKEELAEVDACLITVSDRPSKAPLSQMADAGRKALAKRPSRGDLDDTTDSNLSLALGLWRAKQTLCGLNPGEAQPLDRVLAKLSRQ